MSAPLRAAMVRFSTLDPSLWPRVVRALASLGFNAIDVPIVWREHALPDGRLDFTARNLDVRAFLAVVAGEGMRAVVRLGPWPTSDVSSLGLPDRVLRDRACQARTRRQNPVYVLDLPALSPLPSVASLAYRRACAGWVRAAVAALGPHANDGTVARVIVGHGPPAVLRDDPFEIDHHPDARGDVPAQAPPHRAPREAAVEEVTRQSLHERAFLLGLSDAARAEGIDDDKIALAVTGSALASPVAMSLGGERSLVLAAPPTRAGVTGIWRQVRFACSFGAAPHIDLRAGNPPFEPPTRATHTLHAARVALAAGARDVTVQMGCSGSGWIGALLDERADVRPHAARWQALLAWAATLPEGRELGVDLSVRAKDAIEARAATGVNPLPLGLLAWVGFAPEELAAQGALPPSDLDDVEHSLAEKAVAFRRVLRADDAVEDPTARDAERWAPLAPKVSPEGAALVRIVERDGARAVVVVSKVEGPIKVSPPEGGRWRDEAGVVDGPRPLPGGEVTVLREVVS